MKDAEKTGLPGGWSKRGTGVRGLRGSFTVEATFLYPIIILLIAFMLSISINWYENVRLTAEDTGELRELDTRSEFLKNIDRLFDD